MVYESDFYTTRRPYRPSLSTYTVSSVPSRQVRVLPGLGKVHIVHTYDRIVPYVGHKRLTVVTMPPRVYSTRPSILNKEYERIENRIRPWVGYSATNRYLNSDSAVRTLYINYPITGYSSYNPYTTYYRPSYGYYPKLYRWYYDWPRDYLYWPQIRSYWSNLVNYTPLYKYLDYSYDWPSTYWSIYRSLRPHLKSLDYDFSELENKVDNLRRFVFSRYPITGYYDSLLYPEVRPKVYRPLNLYYDYYYPLKALNYYSDFWPKYNYLSYKYTYPSDRYYHLKGIFDDETRLIRAQTASLLKRVHDPVPRVHHKSWPVSSIIRYDDGLPARLTNDHYINKMITTSSYNPKVEYTTYYTNPVRKYIGSGRLASVTYAGDRAYNRRNNFFLYEDPVQNDIQLLSFYINKFRQEKAQQKAESKVPLSSSRPSRKFNQQKAIEDTTAEELRKLRDEREARWAKIHEEEPKESSKPSTDVDEAVRAKKKQEEARLAEEKALIEEQTRLAAQAKKEEAARKAELARQEELAAQAAAERAAELEKQAELARQQELEKQAEIEKARKAEEERLRKEEQKRLEEEAKAEEERKQLLRLEELARQAEEEKEAELARQAEELAELARQEAELAEQAKKEAEEEELKRQQAELEELEKKQAELEELERQEKELAELAKQEAELAEKAKEEAELAKKEAELAELAQQEAELAELERQQAELDALEAEARALEEPVAAAEPATEAESAEDELARQEAELAELERQQAELDALEAEAKALEAEAGIVESAAEEEEAAAEEEENDAAEPDVTDDEAANE